jgi:pyruvate/2-oxoglutarate/acetoin dehydrogenase E1 component
MKKFTSEGETSLHQVTCLFETWKQKQMESGVSLRRTKEAMQALTQGIQRVSVVDAPATTNNASAADVKPKKTSIIKRIRTVRGKDFVVIYNDLNSHIIYNYKI